MSWEWAELFVWLCFRYFMATWTAPRWKRIASFLHLSLATSGFSLLALCKSRLSVWSWWAAISIVSYTNSSRIYRVTVWNSREWLLCVFVWPGCSLPLGLQKKLNDSSFGASSFYSSLLRSWTPALARLHQEGSANAWRPKVNTNTQIP